MWEERDFSYVKLKENIDKLHKAGIEVYVYFQFAGVSEDVTDEFEPYIVKDFDGEKVIAGRDGRFRNIWANPDPDGIYGASVLKQIDTLLERTSADGVALDRSDLLDYTYKSDLYDYANFNGYSSVFKHGGHVCLFRPSPSLGSVG